MDEFIGDQNFAAVELRAMNKIAVPGYGDIKNTLRQMVIGMGPLELPKVKSICITGPTKCGKKLLVEALCSEMNAVMFDLSPRNIQPIKDVEKFVPFMMQMAKKLQPTVLFIDGAHKPFIKKMSEVDKKEEPKKLAQFLQKKVVKKLNKDDAIMLMGTTSEPWNCNFAQLRRCFERIVSFPPTLDYGTALMTWNKGLHSKRIYNFDASALAQITRNYTTGDILELIDRHVDLQRRMR
jgi:IQ and AAA domain-containing protein